LSLARLHSLTRLMAEARLRVCFQVRAQPVPPRYPSARRPCQSTASLGPTLYRRQVSTPTLAVRLRHPHLRCHLPTSILEFQVLQRQEHLRRPTAVFQDLPVAWLLPSADRHLAQLRRTVRHQTLTVRLGVNLPGVSTSGNVPPVYGSSSAVPPPSNNSPPPYGQSTASPVSSGSSLPFSSPSGNAPPPYGGSTTAPAPTTSSVAPPAETLCPGYNSRNYTDSSGATYTVYCGKGLTGTRYTPTYRRPAQSYTIQSCMDECNQYTACVAASTDGTSCNLFSSVTGSTSSPGTVAAYKVSGPPPSNVQTVTVCANRVTAYTTVWTTATHTTCPADSTCTAASNYDNGFIGTQRARR
jgi:hypothetical protein